MHSDLEHTTHHAALLEELRTLRLSLEETNAKLSEANDTLDAIRAGEVDALIVKSNDNHQLYTLKSADKTYRIFIEQMAEGVVTLNSDNHILYCNSRFAELVGLPLQQAMGQEFCRFIHGDHWHACEDLIKAAWDANTKAEVDIVDSNGNTVPMLLSCKRLDLEENISMSVILTDLSIQKKQQALLIENNRQLEDAEKLARHLNTNLEELVLQRTHELEKTVEEKVRIGEELKNNEQRLIQILEAMAEGVTITDLDGHIAYANPMAQKILDLQPDSNGRYVTSAKNVTLDGEPLPKHETPVHISMATGKPVFDAEIGIELPEKERFYILVNAAPIIDSSNKVVGSVGTFMDVTRRRIAIQQKDDFISVASHELKTPVTVLKTSIQLLDKLKDNLSHDMVPTLIEQANRGMNKLAFLVEDLLDVSRMKEGQLSLNKQLFIIEDMMLDAVAQLHVERQRQVSLTGDLRLQVNADPHRIEQVLVNFINNAIKYAAVSKEIIITVEKKDTVVKISVTDQGPGIEEEKQLQLFDRYYRTNYSGTYSGLGLGLYISAEIVKRHNGQIGVTSKVGEGSTFWFTLPI